MDPDEQYDDGLTGLLAGTVLAAVVIAVLVGGIWLVANVRFLAGYRGIVGVWVMIILGGGGTQLGSSMLDVLFSKKSPSRSAAIGSFFVTIFAFLIYLLFFDGLRSIVGSWTIG